MNPNHPTISVIITTYNRPDMILDCINSVLKQTFQEFEIIVINDCSTMPYPNLEEIDPRIHVYTTEKNSGNAIATNLGLDKAKGRFIACCDDDDWFGPDHLQHGFEFLESEDGQNYHGVYFKTQTIEVTKKRNKVKRKITGSEWDLMPNENPVKSMCSMIFRKSNIRISTDHPVFQDYDLWYQFWKNKKKCKFIPIITSYYRTGHPRITITSNHLAEGLKYLPNSDFFNRLREYANTLIGSNNIENYEDQ